MGCENPQTPTDAAVCEALGREAVDSAVRQELANETNENAARLREAIEKNEISRGLIGQEEWIFFLEYYWLSENDPVQILDEVERIQGWEKPDGKIWPITLEKIYTQDYSQSINSLPFFQYNRWQAYTQMRNYRTWERWVNEQGREVRLRSKWIPSVFNREYYLWHTETENRVWTYADESVLQEYLAGNIHTWNIVGNWLEAFLRTDSHGKQVILAFVDGELMLASYTSIGDTTRYWDDAITTNNHSPSYIFSENRDPWTLTANMYHISWASDSVRNTANSDGTYSSDPMPYAVRILWGEYSHAGVTTGNGRSHGCARMPLYYAKWLYDLFQEHWSIRWDIAY